MSELPMPGQRFEVECPHCKKPFAAGLLSGPAARHQGFKCPHCRLFVPYQRAEERELLDPSGNA